MVGPESVIRVTAMRARLVTASWHLAGGPAAARSWATQPPPVGRHTIDSLNEETGLRCTVSGQCNSEGLNTRRVTGCTLPRSSRAFGRFPEGS